MSKKAILTIFILSLVIGWQLLRPGYYSMHDDLQIMRLYEMDHCFQNGQIPCRLSPDMGQNYTQPMFNYYSAFPYYLGELVHLTGVTYVDTVKLLFLLSLFLSGVFVFLFCGQFLTKNAALLAAIAYMVAPYHAVDIFVRGALAESWGLTLVPLFLYALVKICRSPNSKNAILLSISLGLFLTTHNLTVLISAPLIIILGLYFWLTNPNRKKQFLYLLSGGLLGFGLSAFFFLPVLFERSLIQTSFLVTDYFDFRAHFVTLYQLFIKFSWGYGPSRFNSWQYPETLSFFVGFIPAISLLTTPFVILLSFKKKIKPLLPIIIYLLCLIFLFLTHSRSVFIWDKLPLLAYVQFPWRFLGPVALLSAILIGYNFDFLQSKSRERLGLLSFFIAFLIAVNFSYFKFEKYFPNLTDNVKLTGQEYDNQIRGALLDYLSTSSQKIPSSKAPSMPLILDGEVGINYFDKRSNYFSSEFDVFTSEATVQFPVTYFPGWLVYQNRKTIPIQFIKGNDFGQITIKLTKGHHLIQAFFENTPVRSIGNILIFVSGFVLLSWFILSHPQKHEE